MLIHLSRGVTVEAPNKSMPGLFERVRQHYAQRAARRQLHAFDDRMLRDIGISRSDIDRLTKG